MSWSGVRSLLFVGLLIVLPSQLGFHWWTPWSIILGRRVDYLAPTLYFTDCLILAYVAVSYMDARVRARIHSLISGLRIHPLLLFFVAFVAGANIAIAPEPWISGYVMVKILEYVTLVLVIASSPPKQDFVLVGISMAMAWSIVLALLQGVYQSSLGGPLWVLGERSFTLSTPGIARTSCSLISMVLGAGCIETLRPYATFPHPNVLAGFMATSAVLLVSRLSPVVQTTRLRSIVHILLVTGALLVLLMTESRSAWIALVGGLSVVLFREYQMSSGRLKATSIRWMFVLVALTTIVVLARTSMQDESWIVRSDLLHSSISMIQSSPVFGVGLGNFLIRLPSFMLDRSIYFLQPVHSIYALILSEIGLLGCMLLFIFAWRLRYGIEYRSPFFVAVCMLLFIGLLDHYPLTLQQGQILSAIFLAFSLRTRYDE